MIIKPIANSALQGIQRGVSGMRQNAAEIATPRTLGNKVANRDTVRAMVELHQNSQQVATSVKVLQSADQMIGSLLDVKA